MNHIVKQVAINSNDYTLIITHNNDPKTPISIFINEINNITMNNYIYTIKSLTIYLNKVQQDDSIELLNNLLNKKFNKPTYLNINGYLNNEIVIELFNQIVNEISI
ncbi:uncharacterized protein J8A68_005466 [[Candida] subhashii]|uniref:Uncharacterized protein n=1 Tax=[Candida] subhashii TaxID=561895 RepID=A0A8J5UJ86_9ASCO|nr:uncharacterized protein J8A68_005466 [[Candida] subhashii]KAG7660946.1 hypothetical protein J8A68_005466 [[Candida] subhashii]